MKVLTTAVLLVSLQISNAQIELVFGQPITYQEVVGVNLKKDDVYNKTVLWVAEAYKSSEAVIDLQEDDQGILIGNGVQTIPIFNRLGTWTTGDITYQFKIETKDNKFRITYSEFFYINPVELNLPDTPLETIAFNKKGKQRKGEFNRSVVFGTFKAIEKNIADLKAYINADDDDW